MGIARSATLVAAVAVLGMAAGGGAAWAEEAAKPPATSIRGRVTDAAGKPIAGAKVRSLVGLETVTDKDGYFTDDRVPSTRNAWDITARGYQLERFTYWNGDGKTGVRVVQLVPSNPVTGKVLDAGGKPAHDVQVFGGLNPAMNFFPNWSVPIDAEGAFRMDITPAPKDMQPREMNSIKAEQFCIFPLRGKQAAGDPVWVKPGQTDVTLRLYATGIILVSVTDEQGKPIPKARVLVAVKSTFGFEMAGNTDDNGALFFNAPAGDAKVRLLTAPAGAAADWLMERARIGLQPPSAQIKVEADHTVRCDLVVAPVAEKDKAPTVTGMLLDEDGQPFVHARVGVALKVAAKDEPLRLFRGGARTQADGKFEAAMRLDNGDWGETTRSAPIPPAPDNPGVLRIIVSVEGRRGIISDITRDWPQDARTLDVGQVSVKRLAETAK